MAPRTQHPVMAKAAHYFGLSIKHVPVGPDYRADVKAMEKVGEVHIMCTVNYLVVTEAL